MSEFINTVDLIGDEELTKQIVERTITELKDNTILKLRKSALAHCVKLETVDLPMCEETATYAFVTCSVLKNVNLPRVKKIPSSCFDGSGAIESLKLPSVTEVESGGFSNMPNLKTLEFSSQVLFNYNFGAMNLTALILRSETICTTTHANCFDNNYHISGKVNATYNPDGLKDGYIYVPRALVDSYKTATNWTTYATQFRALEDYTVDGTITGELDTSKI